VAQTRTTVQGEDVGLAERLARIEAALAEILRSTGPSGGSAGPESVPVGEVAGPGSA
jgi:hypothetical protein